MGRIEKRMYRRARGQAMLRRGALMLAVAVIAAGLAGRMRRGDALRVSPVTHPTPTPVTAGFDETVVSREITLEGATWYALQTGIFSTRQAADARAVAYSDRGAPGYVHPDGDRFRVLIACYGTESDAAAVRDRLASRQEVDVYLHRWVLPEMTLRLTGMAGQLDVAEAGLHLIRQSASLLRDTAIALDRSEEDASGALEILAALDEQHRLWRATARQRFGQPHPALIGDLLSLADQWDARYAALQRESASAAALSAAMKIQSMTAYDDLSQLLTRLGAQ